jgi:hypothetical protein
MNSTLIELKEFARKVGVPDTILSRRSGESDWEGSFDGYFDGVLTPMIIRPLAIEVSLPTLYEVLLFRVGEGVLDTELGKLFHVSYTSPSAQGYFQLFRFIEPDQRGETPEYAFTHTHEDDRKFSTAITIQFR